MGSYLPSQTMECSKCGFNGHFSRDCHKYCRWCHSFMKSDHYTGCQYAPTCYRCGEKGHMKRHCQKGKKRKHEESVPRATSSAVCFKCGERGHLQRNCQQAEANHLQPAPDHSNGPKHQSTKQGRQSSTESEHHPVDTDHIHDYPQGDLFPIQAIETTNALAL